jgi:NADH dehydrogenase FAD-containing subunit
MSCGHRDRLRVFSSRVRMTLVDISASHLTAPSRHRVISKRLNATQIKLNVVLKTANHQKFYRLDMQRRISAQMYRCKLAT